MGLADSPIGFNDALCIWTCSFVAVGTLIGY